MGGGGSVSQYVTDLLCVTEQEISTSQSQSLKQENMLRTCKRRICLVPLYVKFWEDTHGWCQDACVLCAGVLSGDSLSITAPPLSVRRFCFDSPPEHMGTSRV